METVSNLDEVSERAKTHSLILTDIDNISLIKHSDEMSVVLLDQFKLYVGCKLGVLITVLILLVGGFLASVLGIDTLGGGQVQSPDHEHDSGVMGGVEIGLRGFNTMDGIIHVGD